MEKTCTTTRHTARQLRAREATLLAALLAGRTVTEAAKDAGMSRSTAYRTWKKREFQSSLREARSELLESTIDQLRTNARAAVDTLNKISSEGGDPKVASARVSAARETLAALYKGIEIYEIEARVRKLERQADQVEEG